MAVWLRETSSQSQVTIIGLYNNCTTNSTSAWVHGQCSCLGVPIFTETWVLHDWWPDEEWYIPQWWNVMLYISGFRRLVLTVVHQYVHLHVHKKLVLGCLAFYLLLYTTAALTHILLYMSYHSSYNLLHHPNHVAGLHIYYHILIST